MNEPQSGLYRTIVLSTLPGQVRALLQDDFHHFRIAIHHDGSAVTGVSGDAIRFPYSLCPDARHALDQLIGLHLSRRVFDISGVVDARLQCTHQFDLAALAIAAAARGQSRRYDLFVTDPSGDRCTATLTRDDGYALHWAITGRIITGPAPFAGINVDQGFTTWASTLPNEDMAEGSLVLRRAHFVLGGRIRLDQLNSRATADPRGSCYVMQPERATRALRIPNSLRDGRHPLPVSAGDAGWLAGSQDVPAPSP